MTPLNAVRIAVAGLAGGIGAIAGARAVAPAQAPAAWVAYAEGVTEAVGGWLQEPGERPSRIRATFDAARPNADQPGKPLMLKLWVDRTGRVTRIETDAAAAPILAADIRTLAVGRQLAVPPRRMIQPLRIAVQLSPAPVATLTLPGSAMMPRTRSRLYWPARPT